MFVKAIKTAQSAMFPVFRHQQIDQQQFMLYAIGSGFFVNTEGFFVTVSHIFDNPAPSTTFFYWGLLPEAVHNPPLVIKEIDREDNLDIFLGKIEFNTTNYFSIKENLPSIGRSVCLSGYPLAQIIRDSQGVFQLDGVRRYFQPSFVLDYGCMLVDNGQGKVRMHEGFLARDLGLFGMSGGPIFDIDGFLVGMQGSITPQRISEGAGGRRIPVENAMIIKTEYVVNILEKNRVAYNKA